MFYNTILLTAKAQRMKLAATRALSSLRPLRLCGDVWGV